MSFLKNLNWRYAVKNFSSKKISSKNLDKILGAIRMAPTSWGLQAFHVYVIANPDIKKKIKAHSFNQPQLDSAAYILVFCTRTDVHNRVDQYVEAVSKGNADTKAKLKNRADTMKKSMYKKDEAVLLSWSARQAYIAFGFGLAACAELKIDSCPMEGFKNEEIDKILKLPPHIKSLGYLAVGYRAEDPTRPKFRFAKNDIFTFI